jgi:uncharacterized repeat protein (TIGR03803 family)
MFKFNWWTRVCAVFFLGATTAIALPAQTFTPLHSFNNTDGNGPEAGLVQGTNGNLYGTTVYGGASNACSNGCGTVFKITPSGMFTTLNSFDNTDGAYPEAVLVQATNGSLYGTTAGGGANSNSACGPFSDSCGTVFKITNGTLTTLYSFCSQSNCADGDGPIAGLVQATNGNLYGTTDDGGANSDGTVFKITPNGTVTTPHSFDNTDGANPSAGLIQGTSGYLYGTTVAGGANGLGTVFRITPRGKGFMPLHSFDNTDGANPSAGLVQGTDGNLYGTTALDGANSGGTLFKITNGTLTTVYDFCSQIGCADGQEPDATLVQGTDGNLYGTTVKGGANNDGTIFQITTSGTLTPLYSFCPQIGCPDGNYAYAALVQDTNGDFYGTTVKGGANGYGTIFSLSVGLGPFAKTLPTSGKVRAAVDILGTDLTGASKVTFNGTAATFTVKTKSEITTTVPTGATTGAVQVFTPRGTLLSNVPFSVLP